MPSYGSSGPHSNNNLGYGYSKSNQQEKPVNVSVPLHGPVSKDQLYKIQTPIALQGPDQTRGLPSLQGPSFCCSQFGGGSFCCFLFVLNCWGMLLECTLGSYRVLHFYQRKTYNYNTCSLYKLMPLL